MTSAHADRTRLPELDRKCDSFISNHVANRASRLQGQALLASAGRIFDVPELHEIGRTGNDTLPHCHLAPVFGAVTRALGLGRASASRLFFFIHLRGLVSSAVRLGIVGPLQGQALQHRLAVRAEERRVRCQNLSVHEAAQTAPLLDLWQANQDRLYSRLFQS
jgi:urease accessory protein